MKSKTPLSILDISLSCGGAEKVISLLLKKLAEDYEVTLFLFYNEIHFPIPEGVNTVIFSNRSPHGIPLGRKLIDLVVFSFKYIRQVKALKIRYAISFLAFPNLVNGILAIFAPRVTTIISERGFPSDNTTSKTSHRIAKVFYPLLYNRCSRLFSNSIFINQDLKSNFGVKIPMQVIYNPIEFPLQQADFTEIGHSEGELKIVNVGSINARKNQMMILKAMKTIGTRIHFTIVGSGGMEQDLKDYAQEQGIGPQLEFAGQVKDVYSYLRRNDVFVLSSNTEGFPNALLEAMSMGLPVISTNCLSGPLELLNDGDEIEIPENAFAEAKYGILVNTDDHMGLAEALIFLEKNPDKRRLYAKLSLERARKFSLDVIYMEYRDFIEKD